MYISEANICVSMFLITFVSNHKSCRDHIFEQLFETFSTLIVNKLKNNTFYTTDTGETDANMVYRQSNIVVLDR